MMIQAKEVKVTGINKQIRHWKKDQVGILGQNRTGINRESNRRKHAQKQLKYKNTRRKTMRHTT